MLVSATVLDLRHAWIGGSLAGIWDVLLLAGAVLGLAALVYCLFFALPFQETYAEQTVRKVYDKGAYALCRHPGILCFFAMYLCLGAADFPGRMTGNALLFSLLNLAYAWFQDRITFPRIFDDYETYRRNVPFLLPTKDSLRMAQNTIAHLNTKEDDS